jgi:hypothetical protein
MKFLLTVQYSTRKLNPTLYLTFGCSWYCTVQDLYCNTIIRSGCLADIMRYDVKEVGTEYELGYEDIQYT